MTKRIERQKELLKAVVNTYNEAVGSKYSITRWPDEEERNTRACDAYAEVPGRPPLAIEHTIIPTFDVQKEKDAQFMKAIGDLEAQLKTFFPYNLSLDIHMSAIQKGQKWIEIRDAVGTWLKDNVAKIPPGKSKVQIPNVPFEVILERDDNLPPSFTVSRTLDSTLDVAEELIKSIAAALQDKNDQLKRYKAQGNRTILVVESQDIALVSSVSIYKAFLKAHAQVQPTNIDQIWLINTYEPEPEFTEIRCLFGPQEMMDRVNPQNAMFGPKYAGYWAEADS
jgi:hypothetical protein